MNVTRGQIYYVDFDQTDHPSIEKCRPAVVVQNDAGNSHSSYTIMAAIKHLDHKALPILVYVAKGEGGLKKESVIDCGQIHTVRKNELLEYCGSLPRHRMDQVDKALAISLGLPRR